MFDLQPELGNDLVFIRPLREADFDALYLIGCDPELWVLHPAKDRWKEAVFRQLFDAALASGGALTVVERQSDSIIGSSRFNVPDIKARRAEIGWSYLARTHWGGFWNREIKRLLMAHAFRFVDTVYFRIGRENLRSRRATEKLGAILTDQTEVLDMADGSRVVHVFYEMSKKSFEAQTP